jgi:prepilin-type N-terminal cleavage/methylation domain-containing protein
MWRYHHTQRGFSLVEILIATAVLGVVAALAAPNMREWSRNYNLKSATTNLYSHMQVARLGAVKDNQPWTVNFNPGGTIGYEVRNSANKAVKTVNFLKQYNKEIQFSNPTSSTQFDTAVLTFNPNGTSNTGFAYLSSKNIASYYRIGLQLANGAVKIQRWDASSSQWK